MKNWSRATPTEIAEAFELWVRNNQDHEFIGLFEEVVERLWMLEDLYR